MSWNGRTDPDEPQEGNYWGEHEKYRVEDWILDAQNGNTRKGYWAWVKTQLALEYPSRVQMIFEAGKEEVDGLKDHWCHQLVIMTYRDDPSVWIECETCNEILMKVKEVERG